VDALDLIALTLRPGEPTPGARAVAREELARAAALGIEIVTRLERRYPEGLRSLADPPRLLYVQGDLRACAERPAIAIVGCRDASARGRSLAFTLARDLARAGIVIVSGLARGIDSAAHEGALAADGTTVAVQGRGLDDVYPAENRLLARRIVAAGGVMLSEHALGVAPRPAHFPRRNRILAGLVRAVVVVEAAERSGALVTARLAVDAGRDVLAVPGHPYDPRASGANALIKDGAGLVRDVRDVLDALAITAAESPGQTGDPVLDSIPASQGVSIEQLAAANGRSVPALLARLSELELQGRVTRLPGPLFVRA
jgi:DNA processing protein